MAAPAYQFQSGTLTWTAAHVEKNLPNAQSGPVELTVRADTAGVFILHEGEASSLPGSGFELTVGKDYVFHLVPVVGTPTENGICLSSPVAGDYQASYVLTAGGRS